jgi:hydrogenase expression/formation protein HypC
MCLAVPGKIASIVEEENFGLRRGKVDFAGIRKEVCLDYTPEARVGDYVLVHVGFALTVVDEQEAKRVFEALRQLDQLEELQLQELQVAELKESAI